MAVTQLVAVLLALLLVMVAVPAVARPRTARSAHPSDVDSPNSAASSAAGSGVPPSASGPLSCPEGECTDGQMCTPCTHEGEGEPWWVFSENKPFESFP
ncbi:hypothetical protein FJT64_004732 [Amphibalanus amphitrite]|uniref:Uncharacterized protein n=1 Tax=Amphibalanus amphitrite TaxID=1232801 RepID=A0A6A4W750_AMPAM|nr:hypothetical protein FJT64_004732 [Amphibalanus amphitrite]